MSRTWLGWHKILRVGVVGAIVLHVLLVEPVRESRAVSVTNRLYGVKFAEKLTRSVKFVHAGVVGHWAEFFDRGTFRLKFKVPLDGVNSLTFSESAGLTVLVQSGGDDYYVYFYFAWSTKTSLLPLTGTMAITENYLGKRMVKAKASAKLKLADNVLEVDLVGNYGHYQTTLGGSTEVGSAVLAGRMLGLTDRAFQGEAIVTVQVFDTPSNQTVTATRSMSFVGMVASDEVIDPQVGTYMKSKVGVAGASLD